MSPARHATVLETVSVTVPEQALELYEAALASACGAVGFFLDEDTGLWRVEGVKDQGAREPELATALALAEAACGQRYPLHRQATPAEGWLARTHSAFPEQPVGRRFTIRGTHLVDTALPGRIAVVVDAALAFGSGEHGSTRGCLRALERVAYRCPDRILDLGTGTGILAMAAAKLLHRPALATDIEPWSVRVARENIKRNGLSPWVRVRRADGWTAPWVTRAAPYDLVFANILARPLCMMARSLAKSLARDGRAVLSGLLRNQVRWVLAAHRRHGLVLETVEHEGAGGPPRGGAGGGRGPSVGPQTRSRRRRAAVPRP